MTDRLTESMLDPLVSMFLKKYASQFYKVLNTRDIRKVVQWLERKYREIIAPFVKEHPWLALLAEDQAGQKTGELLGNYIVEKYEACSPEKKVAWNSSRWLHHGAVGELIVIRETRKHRPFLVGLGRGLMISDLHDQSEWHTPEYMKAKKTLEEMR